MGLLFANHAKSLLISGITANDTTLQLSIDTIDLFPDIENEGDYFYLSLIPMGASATAEVVKVTGLNKSSGTMEVVRGVDGFDAVDHPTRTAGEIRLPAIALNEILAIATEGLDAPKLQRFNFGLPSSEWVITHNKRTTLFEQTIWVQDEDGAHRQHLAPVTLIDDDKFLIEFSHPVVGYVDVRF